MLAQPVFAVAIEFRDAVLGKELRRRPARRGLFSHGFGAVLAEFRSVTVRGGRGLARRATHAVEAIGPVQLQPGTRRARRARPFASPLGGDGDRFEAGRMVLRRADPQLHIVDIDRAARVGQPLRGPRLCFEYSDQDLGIGGQLSWHPVLAAHGSDFRVVSPAWCRVPHAVTTVPVSIKSA